MRLLVACTQCARQYDASGRAVGSRFHCHCGAAVTVARPQGHDAEVVRCGGCGAPRSKGASRCGHCHSDFTLHERDLDTVCPQCFSRVSDRARFCHHCATALTPELAAGDETKLACPACHEASPLWSRRLGEPEVTVLECGHCAGLWVGTESFANVTEKAARIGERRDTVGAPPVVGQPHRDRQPDGGKTFYRPCPICQQLMVRKNYGRRSGVVIDVCRDHGVWLDEDELPRVLTWLRAGGGAESERRTREQEKSRERIARIKRIGTPSREERAWSGGHDPLDPWGAVAGEALELFGWIFKT